LELIILDIIGIIAFALAGYIISSRSDHDLLGITIISFVSAFGGGVTRDILINSTPLIFSTTYPLIVVTIVIAVAFLLKYHHTEKLNENKLFVLADTIGLSTFAYTGAMTGLLIGFNFGGVLFLGLISAVGGGLIRDVIMGKEAYVLKEDFYGIVAIFISILTFFIHTFIGVTIMWTSIIIFSGVILRLIAVKYNWHLPSLSS